MSSFGMYYQNNLYQNNFNAIVNKYFPKEKYNLNKNYVNYEEVTIKQITEIFNINYEYIINGLIAKWKVLSLSDAIKYKDEQLILLNQKLRNFLNIYNDMNKIIQYFNFLLWNSIKSYSDNELWVSNWKSLGNIKSISHFVNANFLNSYLYKNEIPYLEYGDRKYSWMVHNKLIYFRGLQFFEFYINSNYLNLINSFIASSISTFDSVLTGQWNSEDLDELQYQVVKIRNENFSFPNFRQGFIIDRITNVLLIIVSPLLLSILIIIFIIYLSYKFKNNSEYKKWIKFTELKYYRFGV